MIAQHLVWLGLCWLCLALPAAGDTLRIATYNIELSRDGPGLLLRDLVRGDTQADAAAQVIADVAPDILLLRMLISISNCAHLGPCAK